MKNILTKLKKWYGRLHDKKRHVELITAALSVPMMLTVILVNLNNINAQKNKPEETQTPTPIQVIIDNPDKSIATTSTGQKTTIAPTKTECKKEIGPIEILSPQEGEIISTDKVCINISTNTQYCPVTWSYKLGTDNWSEFNNNDICLYNLTPGKKQLQIKIKSAVVDKVITLQRNFIYQNSSQISPIASPSATPSN
ncbi:MAG: hypothetical protein WCG91_03705 [Candidatus Shapirobacteria bacterium]